MTGPGDDLSRVLGEVLTQFGRRIIDRPDLLRGALSDTLGADAVTYRPQVDAVVAASREGIAGQLRDADRGVPASDEQVRAWFDQLVAAGIGLRDAALATRSWAEALDADGTAAAATSVAVSLGAEVASDSPSSSSGAATRREVDPAEAPTELGGVGAIDETVLGRAPAEPVDVPASPAVPDDDPVEDAGREADGEASGAGDGTPLSRRRTVLLRAALFVPSLILAIVVVIVAATQGSGPAQAEPPAEFVPLTSAELDEPIAMSDAESGAELADPVPLLTIAEARRLVLSDKTLKGIVPGGAADSPWSGSTTTLIEMPQVLAPERCTAALLTGATSDVMYRSSGWTGGDPGAWASVFSMVSWFDDSKAAAAAFSGLKTQGDCTSASMVEAQQGLTTAVWTSQSERKAGDLPVLVNGVSRQDGDPFVFERTCYLRTNTVACHVFTGYEVGRIAPAWIDRASRARALDDLATSAVAKSPFEAVE